MVIFDLSETTVTLFLFNSDFFSSEQSRSLFTSVSCLYRHYINCTEIEIRVMLCLSEGAFVQI